MEILKKICFAGAFLCSVFVLRAQEDVSMVKEAGWERIMQTRSALESGLREKELQPGAVRTSLYYPLIENKRIGFVSNRIGAEVLDTLLARGFNVVRIFSPEHGFRGEAEAGAGVDNKVDAQTGIPVVSLYGKSKKPAPASLQDLDILLFDMQDVGVRFYTYISTLHYVMQSCAENGVPLVVLDRPNPHTGYIDGPVLDTLCCRSFVGLHPVPVVYGMTVGEYAQMINGEGWLHTDTACALTVIPMQYFKRGIPCAYPVPPSPNLQEIRAIHAYPSLCFFEGTPVSVGRGTYFPFLCYGFEGCRVGDYEFTPRSMPGYSEHPPFENRLCRGYWMDEETWNAVPQKLDLQPLLRMYAAYPEKDRFFNAFFNKLAGTDKLAAQIKDGLTEVQIRASWQPALMEFDKVRRKYLMY